MAQSLSTNLGIGPTPEFSQEKHPDIWADSQRIRNAIGILQSALDSYTGALSEDKNYWSEVSPATSVRIQNISRVYAKAGETIAAGATVNFYNVSGALTARLANATNNTKPCHAYALAAVNSGDYGEFILGGILSQFSGLTPGTMYYLATSSGNYVNTAPSTAGNIVQQVGYVLTSTTFYFNPVLNWKQL